MWLLGENRGEKGGLFCGVDYPQKRIFQILEGCAFAPELKRLIDALTKEDLNLLAEDKEVLVKHGILEFSKANRLQEFIRRFPYFNTASFFLYVEGLMDFFNLEPNYDRKLPFNEIVRRVDARTAELPIYLNRETNDGLPGVHLERLFGDFTIVAPSSFVVVPRDEHFVPIKTQLDEANPRTIALIDQSLSYLSDALAKREFKTTTELRPPPFFPGKKVSSPISPQNEIYYAEMAQKHTELQQAVERIFTPEVIAAQKAIFVAIKPSAMPDLEKIKTEISNYGFVKALEFKPSVPVPAQIWRAHYANLNTPEMQAKYPLVYEGNVELLAHGLVAVLLFVGPENAWQHIKKIRGGYEGRDPGTLRFGRTKHVEVQVLDKQSQPTKVLVWDNGVHASDNFANVIRETELHLGVKIPGTSGSSPTLAQEMGEAIPWTARCFEALAAKGIEVLVKLSADDDYWVKVVALANLLDKYALKQVRSAISESGLLFEDRAELKCLVDLWEKIGAGRGILETARLLEERENKELISFLSGQTAVTLPQLAQAMEDIRVRGVMERERIIGSDFVIGAAKYGEVIKELPSGKIDIGLGRLGEKKLMPILFWQLLLNIAQAQTKLPLWRVDSSRIIFIRDIFDLAALERELTGLANSGVGRDNLSGLKLAMRAAYSLDSRAIGITRVGAAIVDNLGSPISLGYNGVPDIFAIEGSIFGQDFKSVELGKLAPEGIFKKRGSFKPNLCAEQRAIALAVSLGYGRQLKDSVIYSLLLPCGMCSGAIVGNKIPRVVYASGYESAVNHRILSEIARLRTGEEVELSRADEEENAQLAAYEDQILLGLARALISAKFDSWDELGKLKLTTFSLALLIKGQPRVFLPIIVDRFRKMIKVGVTDNAGLHKEEFPPFKERASSPVDLGAVVGMRAEQSSSSPVTDWLYTKLDSLFPGHAARETLKKLVAQLYNACQNDPEDLHVRILKAKEGDRYTQILVATRDRPQVELRIAGVFGKLFINIAKEERVNLKGGVGEELGVEAWTNTNPRKRVPLYIALLKVHTGMEPEPKPLTQELLKKVIAGLTQEHRYAGAATVSNATIFGRIARYWNRYDTLAAVPLCAEAGTLTDADIAERIKQAKKKIFRELSSLNNPAMHEFIEHPINENFQDDGSVAYSKTPGGRITEKGMCESMEEVLGVFTIVTGHVKTAIDQFKQLIELEAGDAGEMKKNIEQFKDLTPYLIKLWYYINNPQGDYEEESGVYDLGGASKDEPLILCCKRFDPMFLEKALKKGYKITVLKTDEGTRLAHWVIYAQEKGVAVLLVDLIEGRNLLKEIEKSGLAGEKVIFRADKFGDGRAIIKPMDITVSIVKGEQAEDAALAEYCHRHLKEGPAVMANASTLEEIEQAMKNGAAGIGLFRSEYLFGEGVPGLTEYIMAYLKARTETPEAKIAAQKKLIEAYVVWFIKADGIVKQYGGTCLKVRVVELTGDKKNLISQFNDSSRFGVEFYFTPMGQEITLIFLEALFTAYSRGANTLQVFFPQVRNNEDMGRLIRSDDSLINQAKAIITSIAVAAIKVNDANTDEAAERIRVMGILNKIPVGIMVETLEAVANKLTADFQCLGNNDLTRVAMINFLGRNLKRDDAADRPYLDEVQPEVNRVIRQIFTYLDSMFICGQSAAEMEHNLCLLAMGPGKTIIRSMSGPRIPFVKMFLSAMRPEDAAGLDLFAHSEDEVGPLSIHHQLRIRCEAILERIKDNPEFQLILFRKVSAAEGVALDFARVMAKVEELSAKYKLSVKDEALLYPVAFSGILGSTDFILLTDMLRIFSGVESVTMAGFQKFIAERIRSQDLLPLSVELEKVISRINNGLGESGAPAASSPVYAVQNKRGVETCILTMNSRLQRFGRVSSDITSSPSTPIGALVTGFSSNATAGLWESPGAVRGLSLVRTSDTASMLSLRARSLMRGGYAVSRRSAQPASSPAFSDARRAQVEKLFVDYLLNSFWVNTTIRAAQEVRKRFDNSVNALVAGAFVMPQEDGQDAFTQSRIIMIKAGIGADAFARMAGDAFDLFRRILPFRFRSFIAEIENKILGVEKIEISQLTELEARYIFAITLLADSFINVNPKKDFGAARQEVADILTGERAIKDELNDEHLKLFLRAKEIGLVCSMGAALSGVAVEKIAEAYIGLVQCARTKLLQDQVSSPSNDRLLRNNDNGLTSPWLVGAHFTAAAGLNSAASPVKITRRNFILKTAAFLAPVSALAAQFTFPVRQPPKPPLDTKKLLEDMQKQPNQAAQQDKSKQIFKTEPAINFGFVNNASQKEFGRLEKLPADPNTGVEIRLKRSEKWFVRMDSSNGAAQHSLVYCNEYFSVSPRFKIVFFYRLLKSVGNSRITISATNLNNVSRFGELSILPKPNDPPKRADGWIMAQVVFVTLENSLKFRVICDDAICDICYFCLVEKATDNDKTGIIPSKPGARVAGSSPAKIQRSSSPSKAQRRPLATGTFEVKLEKVYRFLLPLALVKSFRGSFYAYEQHGIIYLYPQESFKMNVLKRFIRAIYCVRLDGNNRIVLGKELFLIHHGFDFSDRTLYVAGCIDHIEIRSKKTLNKKSGFPFKSGHSSSPIQKHIFDSGMKALSPKQTAGIARFIQERPGVVRVMQRLMPNQVEGVPLTCMFYFLTVQVARAPNQFIFAEIVKIGKNEVLKIYLSPNLHAWLRGEYCAGSQKFLQATAQVKYIELNPVSSSPSQENISGSDSKALSNNRPLRGSRMVDLSVAGGNRFSAVAGLNRFSSPVTITRREFIAAAVTTSLNCILATASDNWYMVEASADFVTRIGKFRVHVVFFPNKTLVNVLQRNSAAVMWDRNQYGWPVKLRPVKDDERGAWMPFAEAQGRALEYRDYQGIANSLRNVLQGVLENRLRADLMLRNTNIVRLFEDEIRAFFEKPAKAQDSTAGSSPVQMLAAVDWGSLVTSPYAQAALGVITLICGYFGFHGRVKAWWGSTKELLQYGNKHGKNMLMPGKNGKPGDSITLIEGIDFVGDFALYAMGLNKKTHEWELSRLFFSNAKVKIKKAQKGNPEAVELIHAYDNGAVAAIRFSYPLKEALPGDDRSLKIYGNGEWQVFNNGSIPIYVERTVPGDSSGTPPGGINEARVLENLRRGNNAKPRLKVIPVQPIGGSSPATFGAVVGAVSSPALGREHLQVFTEEAFSDEEGADIMARLSAAGKITPLTDAQIDASELSRANSAGDLAGHGNVRKFTLREALDALSDFLTRDDFANLTLAVVDYFVDAKIKPTDILWPLNAAVRAGSRDFIFQLVVKVSGKEKPAFIAAHVARDSEAANLMTQDYDNQLGLSGIKPDYLTNVFSIGEGSLADGTAVKVFTAKWVHYLEMGADRDPLIFVLRHNVYNRDDGHCKVKFIPIQSASMVRDIALQIYRVLALYNEIDITTVSVRDFMLRFSTKAEGITPLLCLKRARSRDSGHFIKFDSKGLKGRNPIQILAELLALRYAAGARYDYSLRKWRMPNGKGNGNWQRFADFDTVLEGFYQGIAELLALKVKAEDIKMSADSVVAGVLDEFVTELRNSETGKLANNVYILENAPAILEAIMRFRTKMASLAVAFPGFSPKPAIHLPAVPNATATTIASAKSAVAITLPGRPLKASSPGATQADASIRADAESIFDLRRLENLQVIYSGDSQGVYVTYKGFCDGVPYIVKVIRLDRILDLSGKGLFDGRMRQEFTQTMALRASINRVKREAVQREIANIRFLNPRGTSALPRLIAHGELAECVGVLPAPSLYIVLSYVEGTTLKELIAGGLYDARIHRSISLALAQTILADFHAPRAQAPRGVLHSDIKPDNVLICGSDISQPRVVLLDLANSIIIGQAALVGGTPEYMLPWYAARIRDVEFFDNAHMDIFSFGVTVFETVTRRKFSHLQVRVRHMEAVLQEAEELLQGSPLSNVVLGCLRVGLANSEGYQSFDEIVADIGKIAVASSPTHFGAVVSAVSSPTGEPELPAVLNDLHSLLELNKESEIRGVVKSMLGVLGKSTKARIDTVMRRFSGIRNNINGISDIIACIRRDGLTHTLEYSLRLSVNILFEQFENGFGPVSRQGGYKVSSPVRDVSEAEQLLMEEMKRPVRRPHLIAALTRSVYLASKRAGLYPHREADHGAYKVLPFSVIPEHGLLPEDQLENCLKQVRSGVDFNASMIDATVLVRAYTDQEFAEKKAALQRKWDKLFAGRGPPAPVTFVAQPPLNYSEVALECVFIKPNDGQNVLIEYKELNGFRYVIVSHDGLRWLHAGGLTIDAYGNIEKQSEGVFVAAESILKHERFAFKDIVEQRNYISNIVGYTPGGKQHYQIFNDWRAKYYGDPKDWVNGYPGATGIGMTCGGVVIKFTAFDPGARKDVDVFICPVKNLLQVSAFEYNVMKFLEGDQATAGLVQKATPKFERAKVILIRYKKLNLWVAIIYVSGTAGIRGEFTEYSGIIEGLPLSLRKDFLDMIDPARKQGQFIPLNYCRDILKKDGRLLKEAENISVLKDESAFYGKGRQWSIVKAVEGMFKLPDGAVSLLTAQASEDDWLGPNACLQTGLTLDNIAYLISAENLMHEKNLGSLKLGIKVGAKFSDMYCMRTFVKVEAEKLSVVRVTNSRLAGIQHILVESDICRPDLVVETHGVGSVIIYDYSSSPATFGGSTALTTDTERSRSVGAAVAAVSSPSDSSTESLQPRILLVDDQEQLRRLYDAILTDGGYAVECAADAIEALAIISARGQGYFHLLLLDIGLPGIDGLKLRDELSRKGVNAPVLLMTGYPEDLDAFTTALSKPFLPATLIREVREAIGLVVRGEANQRTSSPLDIWEGMDSRSVVERLRQAGIRAELTYGGEINVTIEHTSGQLSSTTTTVSSTDLERLRGLACQQQIERARVSMVRRDAAESEIPDIRQEHVEPVRPTSHQLYPEGQGAFEKLQRERSGLADLIENVLQYPANVLNVAAAVVMGELNPQTAYEMFQRSGWDMGWDMVRQLIPSKKAGSSPLRTLSAQERWDRTPVELRGGIQLCGGDCPCPNAVAAFLSMLLRRRGYMLAGIIKGIGGLAKNPEAIRSVIIPISDLMEREMFDGPSFDFGSTRDKIAVNKDAKPGELDKEAPKTQRILENIIKNFAFIIQIGGNDHLNEGRKLRDLLIKHNDQLRERCNMPRGPPVRVFGLPKTIDWDTLFTMPMGPQSAGRATLQSAYRAAALPWSGVMVFIEAMGRDCGGLLLPRACV
ncbi:MAG: response regulator [Candidatus Omnitrophica bacterium]|nr:response regulator [Candidatus Omnitrophota bacterium]